MQLSSSYGAHSRSQKSSHLKQTSTNIFVHCNALKEASRNMKQFHKTDKSYKLKLKLMTWITKCWQHCVVLAQTEPIKLSKLHVCGTLLVDEIIRSTHGTSACTMMPYLTTRICRWLLIPGASWQWKTVLYVAQCAVRLLSVAISSKIIFANITKKSHGSVWVGLVWSNWFAFTNSNVTKHRFAKWRVIITTSSTEIFFLMLINSWINVQKQMVSQSVSQSVSHQF